MNNQLATFNFEGSTVQTITKNNELWFIAKDVCDVLDLSNVSQSLARLDDDEKGITTTDTLGGNQELSIINESGMYSLALTSRKPKAKRFKKWVTSEVLPTIRKTGNYSITPIDPMALFSDPAAMLQLATDYAKRLIEKDEVIAQQAPKVAALELLSSSEGSLCVRDAANSLGVMQSKLSKWMEANGWAYRKNGKNKDLAPYRPHIKSGVLEYEPVTIPNKNGLSITKLQMRVTPKGLAKLAAVFSNELVAL